MLVGCDAAVRMGGSGTTVGAAEGLVAEVLADRAPPVPAGAACAAGTAVGVVGVVEEVPATISAVRWCAAAEAGWAASSRIRLAPQP